MSRHAASKSPRRALLRAGLTLTAAGAALASGGAAQAAPAPDLVQATGVTHVLDALDGASPVRIATSVLEDATAGGLAPVKDLRLNPLSGTGADPLDNVVGTQIADFQPLSTGLVTSPLSEGADVRSLPLVGEAVSVLPG
ncbi:hypothetical protein [Streptomyces sp. H27-C3]|uniref:hypothetical protein n=1 Tax=Streptomyces sp. H27-C3 TaxID=3046305 RepID=UPI0024B8B824|nr:hypothetical protein [Streptomyces sp. H27-C3]MDJ0465082.1 hypothetical protein [Streptomyces sp. H27-C3]